MQTTYAQKNDTVQKTSVNTVESVIDSSSQSATLQRHASLAKATAQRAPEPRPNLTGMPDNLKSGIESFSGFSMDDVRVHYNSSKPATVQALAYTQGTDIHVAPGQEKHLPHEAWHVAQQMAGRVSPTTNINGMPVNDNAALEHEADVMGEKAALYKNSSSIAKASQLFANGALQCRKVLQRTSYWKKDIRNDPIEVEVNPYGKDDYWECSADDVVICRNEGAAKQKAINDLTGNITGNPEQIELNGNVFYFYESSLNDARTTIQGVVKHNFHDSIDLPSLTHKKGKIQVKKHPNLVHFHTIELSFPQKYGAWTCETYDEGKGALHSFLSKKPRENFEEGRKHYLIAPFFFEE